MSHPPRRGFTLIELMMVVAIIAILALIALPSFQDRIIRNQIREALPLADIAKPPVQAAWAASQPLPADNAAAGLPAAEKIVNEMVQSVAVRDGAIDITFGPRANGALRGKTLSLRPAVVEDARIVPVTWLCGAATAPTPMVAKGEDRTTVPARFLPPRCRG